MQLYVNCFTDELNDAVLAALPDLREQNPVLCWTAPLQESWAERGISSEPFFEPRDREFLKRVHCEGLAEDLKAFWPGQGPKWDGLAIAKLRSGEFGVILAEGKAYPDEVYGTGCAAKEEGGRPQIRRAIAETQAALGVNPALEPEDWMKPLPGRSRKQSLYQSANRLAHLHFFRKHLQIDRRRPAWLVNILFTSDERQPTTIGQWEKALERFRSELGLDGEPAHSGHAFLPARSFHDWEA